MLVRSRLPVEAVVLLLCGCALRDLACLRPSDILKVRLFANSDVLLLDGSGDWREGRLAAGSLITPRYAWIRVEAAGRVVYSALHLPTSGVRSEWRRLLVISRHFADV